MPAAAPRPYHHGNLRRALIDAGVELAAENGPGAVVLREATRRVGASHNAGYRHFAGREELLSAVAEEGMSRLAAAMTDALDAVGTVATGEPAAAARARLRALGHAYLGFAHAHPGLFRTAFASGEPPSAFPSAAGSGPFGILSGVIDEFVAAGVLPVGHRSFSEIAAWSAVHGLAGLSLDGPLRALPPIELAGALDRLCSIVETGLRA